MVNSGVATHVICIVSPAIWWRRKAVIGFLHAITALRARWRPTTRSPSVVCCKRNNFGIIENQSEAKLMCTISSGITDVWSPNMRPTLFRVKEWFIHSYSIDWFSNTSTTCATEENARCKLSCISTYSLSDAFCRIRPFHRKMTTTARSKYHAHPAYREFGSAYVSSSF